MLLQGISARPTLDAGTAERGVENGDWHIQFLPKTLSEEVSGSRELCGGVGVRDAPDAFGVILGTRIGSPLDLELAE